MRISGNLSILLCCAGLLSGCRSAEEQWSETTSGKIYRGTTFEIRVPVSVTPVMERKQGFVVHYFRVGESKCMMGIYEGLQPKPFANKERNLDVIRRGTTHRPGIEGDDVFGIDSNGKLWRESVWSCQEAHTETDGKINAVASLIHIWYFRAEASEQEIFDSMAETIQMQGSRNFPPGTPQSDKMHLDMGN